MAVLDLQRRGQQIGRIRLGVQRPTGEKDRRGRDKMRPEKLDVFRFTTQSRATIDAIAQAFGGEVREWQGEWEVITKTSAIPVTVPPREQIVSQWYEMWTAGGAQRRCDSRRDQISGGPCLCPHAEDPDDAEEVARCALERARLAKLSPPKACHLITRISVMIPDLPGLGVWRVDTHSFYAASEIGDSADLMQMAREQGVFMPAILRIEQRSRVAAGQTRNYPVLVLEITATFRQLATGQLGEGGIVAQLPPAPGEQPKALPAGPSATKPPAAQGDPQQGSADSPPRSVETDATHTPSGSPAPQAPADSEPLNDDEAAYKDAQRLWDEAFACHEQAEFAALADQAKARNVAEVFVCTNRDTDEWGELLTSMQDLWRERARAGEAGMTLKTRKRYQPRAPYAYCKQGDWNDSGTGSPGSRVTVAEAEVHHLATGHEVVVEWQQRLVIGAEPEHLVSPRRSCAHDYEDAPHGVIGCCAEGAA